MQSAYQKLATPSQSLQEAKVGFLTDSGSLIPTTLAKRFNVTVVPNAVIIDGILYFEGVDLTADDFYRIYRTKKPNVEVEPPSVSAYREAFKSMAADGIEHIIAVHASQVLAMSIHSARKAAVGINAKIYNVESHSAAFGVTACLLEIARSVEVGKPVEDSIADGGALSSNLNTVATVDSFEDLRAFSVLRGQAILDHSDSHFSYGDIANYKPLANTFEDAWVELSDEQDLRNIICIRPGPLIDVYKHVADTNNLARAMERCIVASAPIVTALGVSNQAGVQASRELEQLLSARSDVVEIFRYRSGPSVAAYAGPNVIGAYWWHATH